MSEAITGAIVAVAALLGAAIREWTLRRQKGQRIDAEAAKLTAEAALDDATTLETVNGVVQGLILVMQGQLNDALKEVRQLRSELDAEKERTKLLTAEVADLEARLTAAEQETTS